VWTGSRVGKQYEMASPNVEDARAGKFAPYIS